MPIRPELKRFGIERSGNGVLHLIFGTPGRSMNIFSNAAIEEIDLFADWLKQSDVAGVVIRSGMSSAFCAGADLAELETAYDMIMAAAPTERDGLALPFLSAEPRLAQARDGRQAGCGGDRRSRFGGGCEFALAAHHRVIANQPQATFGLPESLVGSLPGSGGNAAVAASDRDRGGTSSAA